ncbi:MAG: hypothetical protein Q4G68_07820 [Planctomycetia bacterium]|nr:hypothetical protein [Planctomycetia bacterium]
MESIKEAILNNIPLVVVVMSGVIIGTFFGILAIRRKMKDITVNIFTYDDATAYAKKMQEQHPEIVSTMISFIVNEKTGKKTIIQTLIDKNGNVIQKNNDELLGRIFYVKQVCEKLNDLLQSDAKCTIAL